MSQVTAETPALPEKPALAPWCRVIETDGRLLVEHGDTVVTFEGDTALRVMPALLRLLDGTRSREEIESLVGDEGARLVAAGLRLLCEHSLLVDGQHGSEARTVPAAVSYVEALSGWPRDAQVAQRLAGADVAVLGSSGTARETLRLLQDAGVGQLRAASRESLAASTTFVVAAPAPCERDELEALNTRQLARREPWLHVLPYDGRRVVVGPLILPGTSACHRCFLLRRAACSGYEDDFDAIDRVPTRAVAPASLEAIAGGLASLLALRWLGTGDPTLPGTLYALDAASSVGLKRQRALRVPRCSACGPFERALPTQWFDERA